MHKREAAKFHTSNFEELQVMSMGTSKYLCVSANKVCVPIHFNNIVNNAHIKYP